MTDIIRVKGLSKYFGNFHAVNNLNLTVKQGEIYGFLGANGSGKTTTMKMLSGLLTPTSGHGECLGFDLLNAQTSIQKMVGYMPQHFGYYTTLSVRENLAFIAGLHGLNIKQSVDASLDRFDLTSRQHQLTGTLSGGWKQRLSLAASIMHQPKLLLLDEPTAGVDPDSRRYFWDTIAELASSGMTVLVSTHYMDEAERCTYLGFMHQGKLVKHGMANHLVQQAPLKAYYVHGAHLMALGCSIEQQFPDVIMIRFGRHLHIIMNKCIDEKPMIQSISQQYHGTYFTSTELSIEHLFIYLIRRGQM
ncbi:MAG: ABC transporter ATP-binding protein [Pseudomonadota bacterium]|nr:ABC transporter ATP-binding protein [Pseudomonadota bacterium]